MKYLKSFSDTNSIIYCFDLDDTLVRSDTFNNLSIKFLKENITIKSLLNSSVKKIGKSIKDIKYEHGKMYIDDPEESIGIIDNWVRKGKRVYLLEPTQYNKTDMSMPKKLLELSNLYKSVKNKCIITGRIDIIKDKIEESIKNLGIEYPNYGLHCYPSRTNVPVWKWKANKIIKIVSDNNFSEAKFYDDNSKSVNRIDKIIKEELPNLKWESIKVKM